ncbi:hypothetical protein PAL_GLEAN10025643 [Pteropus alecto]|uniref:Uncharacterized protein n=1 Tax=Pteropus alecto TaxID=9402 RepID=L5JQU9_PTEAL|nr:hypothetical protein PAL_GLEAN10025643 [Pteropus alecto]
MGAFLSVASDRSLSRPPWEPQSLHGSLLTSILSLQAPLRTMRPGFSSGPQGARMAARPTPCGHPRTTTSS